MIAVIAGGSGSAQLQKALNAIVPVDEISVVVNLYDNGLSTGECRRIFNYDILGPSDLRKNHLTGYQIVSGRQPNNDRFTGHVQSLINKENDPYINDAIAAFASHQDYVCDMAEANIIYSGLFHLHGVMDAAKLMARRYRLPENYVVPHSSSNLFLYATTDSGLHIPEEDIAFNLFEGRIVDATLHTDHAGTSKPVIPFLSEEAYYALAKADTVVISSGTFWSSLYPTYLAYGFSDAIRHKHVVGIVNQVEDNDVKNVLVSDLMEHTHQILGREVEWYADHDSANIAGANLFRVPLRTAATPAGKHDVRLLQRLMEHCL